MNEIQALIANALQHPLPVGHFVGLVLSFIFGRLTMKWGAGHGGGE